MWRDGGHGASGRARHRLRVVSARVPRWALGQHPHTELRHSRTNASLERRCRHDAQTTPIDFISSGKSIAHATLGWCALVVVIPSIQALSVVALAQEPWRQPLRNWDCLLAALLADGSFGWPPQHVRARPLPGDPVAQAAFRTRHKSLESPTAAVDRIAAHLTSSIRVQQRVVDAPLQTKPVTLTQIDCSEIRGFGGHLCR